MCIRDSLDPVPAIPGGAGADGGIDTVSYTHLDVYKRQHACYTPAAITALIDSYGPLWLAGLVPLSGVANPVPHIRVVTGFEGGRAYINDPWPVNRGSIYTLSLIHI